MICTSLQNLSLEGLLEKLPECEMAEIRLDRCPLSSSDIGVLFAEDIPLVATCRIEELQAAGMTFYQAAIEASKRLSAAIKAGARYVDIELGTPKEISRKLISQCRECGTQVIRSFHDFKGTPSAESLEETLDKCLYYGADIVKIVTTAFTDSDCAVVESLYDKCAIRHSRGEDFAAAGHLIAFCMGDKGSHTRVECLKRGAPFSYAGADESNATAPGQIPAPQMREMVYGHLKCIRPQEPLYMPCSKSFAQRAIFAAALSSGTSTLGGYTPCADNEAALGLARSLGAQVTVLDNGTVSVTGIGASPCCIEASTADVGESGLLTRLALPVLSTISRSERISYSSHGTLSARKLSGVVEMLSKVGVKVSGQTMPLETEGDIECFLSHHDGKTVHVEVNARSGSQLVSGLLMALPLCSKNITLTVKEPKSIPYMFITLDVLKHFGIKISNEMMGGRDFMESGGDWNLCNEMIFKIKGGQRYQSCSLDLEADWSSAAPFLVAGAIFGRSEFSNLDTSSVQSDLCIMDILIDAGASLSQASEGSKGLIAVQKAPLEAFEADLTHCPDLFPIVSVLASFCEGRSRIEGLDRLSHKECDRADAIENMLSQMGVAHSIEGNCLVVQGQSLARRSLNGNLLRGGRYTSHADHRMVMALRVASLGASSPIEIDDTGCVGKSFPSFNEMFDSFACDGRSS